MIDNKLIKKTYPQPIDAAYLNTSSSGLVSEKSIEKANRFNQQLFARGSAFVEEFYLNEIPKIRRVISEFLDASIEEIALIPNFSYGLNAVIPSISNLNRVLLFRDDYPSLTLPFKLNDFEIFWLQSEDGFTVDLNEIETEIVRHKIDVLAISHVQYLTGFVIDIESLKNICKKHDVLLILDATQSLGAFPFSFKDSGVNILITSNYKWMNSGYGTGILCIDRETLLKHPPKIGGFNSYKYIDNKWDFSPGINSYEPGHFNMSGLTILKEAIDFKMHIGIKNIGNHNYHLLQQFVESINASSLEMVGSIENISRKNIIGIKGGHELEKHLIDQGIIVKMRNSIVRIGFHFYNTIEDVNRLVNALDNYIST